MLSGVCHRASLPSNATPRMLGSLTLATCRCRAATEIYLLTYLLTGTIDDMFTDMINVGRDGQRDV